MSTLSEVCTLEYRTANELWGRLLAEVYVALGGQHVVISPGSRSTPLVLGLAAHPRLRCISVLDERSAGFLALGMARASGLPVLVVTTSGTAAANLLPAVVEARESRVPLLVVTADRPPELRHCHSGQTIDQVKLFGDYPLEYQEVMLPEANEAAVACWRQVLTHAWFRAQGTVVGTGGPVHLNVPLRDPLVAPQDAALQQCQVRLPASGKAGKTPARQNFPSGVSGSGLLIAGVAEWGSAEIEALHRLTAHTGWPLLVDALSGLREQLEREGIATYDLALRNEAFAQTVRPDVVLQLGALPTSKILRQRLTEWQPLLYVCDPAGRNLNPLHLSGGAFACGVKELEVESFPVATDSVRAQSGAWQRADFWCRQNLDLLLEENPHFEGRWTREIRAVVEEEVPLLVGNSMPVRDWEYFHSVGACGIRTFCNRGANGIDGTLSTAVGLAEACGRAILVTGDLGLLHDTNGFLHHSRMRGELLVLLIDNQGGGIFRHLPVHKVNPPFDEFFLTPQSVQWETLCRAYGIAYAELPVEQGWQEWLRFTGTAGIRVLRWNTNSEQDAALRMSAFARLSAALPKDCLISPPA